MLPSVIGSPGGFLGAIARARLGDDSVANLNALGTNKQTLPDGPHDHCFDLIARFGAERTPTHLDVIVDDVWRRHDALECGVALLDRKVKLMTHVVTFFPSLVPLACQLLQMIQGSGFRRWRAHWLGLCVRFAWRFARLLRHVFATTLPPPPVTLGTGHCLLMDWRTTHAQPRFSLD
jgi:hypothetical protein